MAESIAESEGIFHLEKKRNLQESRMDELRHEKDFCECLLNKDADDPHSNRVAGQPLCFLLHNTIHIIHKSKI